MASVPATDPLSVIVRRLCAPLLRIVAAGVALAGSLPQAAAVGVDFVYVGDAGIAADTIGYGAVASAYAIGVFELTNAQSVEFLNAVDPDGANPNSIYSPNMGSDARGGISFTSGNSAGSKYASRTSMAAKPVSFVSWFDGARFTNWLQNGGSTYGTTSSGSTAINRGAYTLNGATSGTAPAVTAGSTYRIPNENEWYKAAYDKGSGTNAGYWTYATQSNTAPSLVGATAVGTGTAAGSSPVTTGNYANDNNGADWNGLDGNVTTVGTNGGKSAYGTFDMTGNVYEWNDLTGTSDSVRGLRGGSWSNSGAPGYMTSSDRTTAATSFDLGSVGFRLASVVPTSLSWNVGSGTWNSSALKWTNGKGCNYAFPAGSSSTFSSSSGGTVTISGSVTASAITVSATSGTYSFVSSAGNLITGTTGLAKSGGGTLVLSGSNTFTGATSVSGGKLLVDGVLASSTTTVATAALLGGSGTISGAVLVGTSGTLSPGNSPGILTVNSLSLTGSAFSRMEIVGSGSTAGVAGTSYDQVGVTTANGLSFGGTLDLDFGGRTSLFEQGTAFQLFSLSGTTSGDFTTIRTIDASGTYAGLTFSQSAYVVGEWTTWIIPGSGSQYLVFSETTGRLVALPEPSAVAMAALGAGLAGWRLVRRGRRAVAVFPRKAVIFFSEAGFGRGVRTVGGEPLVSPGGRLTNRFGVFPAAWNRSCKHPSVATGNGCRRQSEPAFRHGAVRSAPSAGGAWSFPRVETPVGNPAR